MYNKNLGYNKGIESIFPHTTAPHGECGHIGRDIYSFLGQGGPTPCWYNYQWLADRHIGRGVRSVRGVIISLLCFRQLGNLASGKLLHGLDHGRRSTFGFRTLDLARSRSGRVATFCTLLLQEGLLLLGVESVLFLFSLVAVFNDGTTTRGLAFIVSWTHLCDREGRI